MDDVATLDPGAELDMFQEALASAVRPGLSSMPKWLPAWLFYDAEGSRLFERITGLPEYYPTRTERAIFADHAETIVDAAMQVYRQAHGDRQPLRMLELGAGTATKTGILLAAAVRSQGGIDYLPIDVSEASLDEACTSLAVSHPRVHLIPQLANYVTDALRIPPHDGPTLALYIGSSIGNFSPDEAVSILRNLRAQLRAGDSLLLGTDLVKDERTLLAAYDDREGVTAAFNLNVLRRINRDLRATFNLSAFQHRAVWNAEQSRIEMHLVSTQPQVVTVPDAGLRVTFAAGETVHTENSYKFTDQSIQTLLEAAGFAVVRTWHDERKWFAVTLAAAIL